MALLYSEVGRVQTKVVRQEITHIPAGISHTTWTLVLRFFCTTSFTPTRVHKKFSKLSNINTTY